MASHIDRTSGGKWVRDENGVAVYYGDHMFNDIREKYWDKNNKYRMYEYIIHNCRELSKNYIIPSDYKIYPIREMEGPKTHEEYIKTSV